MSTSAPDELSVENPLCDSSLGSMVTSDYVTPLTESEREREEEGERAGKRESKRECVPSFVGSIACQISVRLGLCPSSVSFKQARSFETC